MAVQKRRSTRPDCSLGYIQQVVLVLHHLLRFFVHDLFHVVHLKGGFRFKYVTSFFKSYLCPTSLQLLMRINSRAIMNEQNLLFWFLQEMDVNYSVGSFFWNHLYFTFVCPTALLLLMRINSRAIMNEQKVSTRTFSSGFCRKWTSTRTAAQMK